MREQLAAEWESLIIQKLMIDYRPAEGKSHERSSAKPHAKARVNSREDQASSSPMEGIAMDRKTPCFAKSRNWEPKGT